MEQRKLQQPEMHSLEFKQEPLKDQFVRRDFIQQHELEHELDFDVTGQEIGTKLGLSWDQAGTKLALSWYPVGINKVPSSHICITLIIRFIKNFISQKVPSISEKGTQQKTYLSGQSITPN